MKHIVLGILAHVDAGKTTLSENLLYLCGRIRSMGRVDNGDSFLDQNRVERDRGITVFSKQARLTYGELSIDLIDTPGHVDFSAEMERTLQVLDYAVLLISAADGVAGHTLTLWRLLERYGIPTFIFVNKMDQPGADRNALTQAIRNGLCREAFDMEALSAQDEEDLIACRESWMEEYLSGNRNGVSTEELTELVAERKAFPVYYGSALKSEGIEALLAGIARYSRKTDYAGRQEQPFGATVYKITRDGNTRLTHMKITGGKLKVRSVLAENGKVNEIRFYSGDRYEAAEQALAGEVCAVTGLEHTYSGQILGEGEASVPLLEPVLTYRVILPEGTDPMQLMPKLRELEEEIPELHLQWDEETKEIHADLMGEVQTEVLTGLVAERFGVEIGFGPGKILYKETILDVTEGVGHFEPLRHYAEVHLLLEPGERGSGLQFESRCREEILAGNWQRLILTHLGEKLHRGVLTGAPLTDVKITVMSGRASNKHTEGGDFRQATYRAVRQGLMKTRSVLLEPYYDYELRVPEGCIGRAMTDLERMHAVQRAMDRDSVTGEPVLSGTAPVSAIREYAKEVMAYTKGYGTLTLSFNGYDVCHETEDIVAEKGYEPEADLRNTPDSVFCAHGAGFTVPWYEVEQYMHVESCLAELPGEEEALNEAARIARETAIRRSREQEDGSLMESVNRAMGYEEVDAILQQATHANTRKASNQWKHEKNRQAVTRTYVSGEDYRRAHEKSEARTKRKYLLVDGYNVIHAWQELSELAAQNMDGARGKLLDILCNYRGLVDREIIVVFDAYRRYNHPTEYLDYHNIHVVYTKTAETADRYIERFAHDHKEQYEVAVATSDGLEQIIIRGQNAVLISSREFEQEVRNRCGAALEEYREKTTRQKI